MNVLLVLFRLVVSSLEGASGCAVRRLGARRIPKAEGSNRSVKIVVLRGLGLSTPIDYAAKVSVKFLTSQM